MIVFVHGFLGHPERTWTDFKNMLSSESDADAVYFGYLSVQESCMNGAEDLKHFLGQLALTKPFADRKYREITLVGHSQGAIVIRQMVLSVIEKQQAGLMSGVWSRITGLDDLDVLLLSADIALFAPAHLGFSPSGGLAYLSGLGLADCATKVVSPSYVEMASGEFLKNLQHKTEHYQASQGPRAAFARVVFGRKEQVVTRGAFLYDRSEDQQPEKDHISVCKPNPDYRFPIKFVLDRI
jgi:hypothetical protein